MVQKLRSYFGNPIALRSYVSAIVVSGLIGIYAAGVAPALLALCALCACLFIYSKMPDRRAVRWSFWTVIFAYMVGISYTDRFLSFVSPGIVWTAIISSFLAVFFLVVGTGNFLFEDRKGIYGVLHTAVIFISALVFGGLALTTSWFWYAPLFAASALLMGEFLRFAKVHFPRRTASFSVVFGLFFVELFIVGSFLPIGVIHMAIFASLFALTLKNLVIMHILGISSKKMFLREISIFLLGTILVFSLSQWTI